VHCRRDRLTFTRLLIDRTTLCDCTAGTMQEVTWVQLAVNSTDWYYFDVSLLLSACMPVSLGLNCRHGTPLLFVNQNSRHVSAMSYFA
jgi:hypothetical protein